MWYLNSSIFELTSLQTSKKARTTCNRNNKIFGLSGLRDKLTTIVHNSWVCATNKIMKWQPKDCRTKFLHSRQLRLNFRRSWGTLTSKVKIIVPEQFTTWIRSPTHCCPPKRGSGWSHDLLRHKHRSLVLPSTGLYPEQCSHSDQVDHSPSTTTQERTTYSQGPSVIWTSLCCTAIHQSKQWRNCFFF